jgi:hydroxyethylthiazole kinase-like sugar kinase family protein
MFSNFKSNIAEITKLINKEDKGKGINEDAWNSVLKIICDISNQYYKELSNMKDNYINTTTNKAIES